MVKMFIFLIVLLLTAVAVSAEALMYGRVITTATILQSIKINEIMYNPKHSQCDNDYCEWIELYNPSDYGMNMSGWKLCGATLEEGYVNHTDGIVYSKNGTVIPANGYAVITDGGSGTEVYDNFEVNSSAIAIHVDDSSMCWGGLSNVIGDMIILQNPRNVLSDYVFYRTSWGANGNGHSLERINATGPSNDKDNWRKSENVGGTPGQQNS